MNLFFVLFLYTSILYVNCDLIQLKGGLINGTVGKSPKGRVFHQFYGLPYAKPPVGELRLKDPVPFGSWSDVKDASKPPPKCTQPIGMFDHKGVATGQEDCLYLNVFVPHDLFKPSGKAAVMVGIHGGGFIVGQGIEYSPDYFMDRDVIFVTINYRLGALGFFGLNNDVISGNFGMKDQVLALRWVQENIANFGGDPGQVTLIGESAGSMSVHFHQFSPLSKGLFGKAIMQSGTALSELSHYEDEVGEVISTGFLVALGCGRKDPTMILKCLQRIPANDFIAFEYQFHDWKPVPLFFFKPMIESKVKTGPFLTQNPTNKTYETYVPWIMGINSADGAVFITNDKPLKVDKETILKRIKHYVYTTEVEDIDKMIQKISDRYFGNQEMGVENMTLKFVELATDIDFLGPFMKSVKWGRGSRQQYAYVFDHRGSFSFQDWANFSFDVGVCHADELPLLYRDEALEAKWTPQDRKVSETLVKFWSNFAISGDPNRNSKEKTGELWEPVKTDDIEYLRIKSDSVVMEKKSLKERFDFWESLPIHFKYS